MEELEEGLPEGTLFGRYRIERRLGAGAMGAVYAATHVGLNKPVVVKVLLPEHAQSRAVRARFLREGEAAARIRHPHVVDVTDVGMHQEMPFLVMERLEGESLGAMLGREGALTPSLAVDLLLPVIAAVDAAHAAGVVHRDLKPENLFVARTPTGDPLPKVLDFGISRVVSDEGVRQTGTAAILGTPAYMAPEQIASSRDADARTDQYSLGVILYECLTGHRVFTSDNIYGILRQVGAGEFVPPRRVRPDLPPALEAVVLRAMARDPAARFGSLRELASALMPFASERGRVLWGGTFPLATASVVPPPASRASAAPAPIADTLVEAVGSLDALPATPQGRRPRAALLGVVAVLVAAGVVAVAQAGTSARSDARPRATTHISAPPASPPSAPVPAAPAAPEARPSTPPVAVPGTPAEVTGPPANAATTPDAGARRGRHGRHAPRPNPLDGINAAP